VLNTGARNPIYYHSRYHNITRFRKAFPTVEMEMNPADAQRMGINNSERVRVISEIGTVEVRVKIVNEAQILPGFVEIPHQRGANSSGFRRNPARLAGRQC
jgi:anaerobic selenocysteine-containing dehydrogenase